MWSHGTPAFVGIARVAVSSRAEIQAFAKENGLCPSVRLRFDPSSKRVRANSSSQGKLPKANWSSQSEFVEGRSEQAGLVEGRGAREKNLQRSSSSARGLVGALRGWADLAHTSVGRVCWKGRNREPRAREALVLSPSDSRRTRFYAQDSPWPLSGKLRAIPDSGRLFGEYKRKRIIGACCCDVAGIRTNDQGACARASRDRNSCDGCQFGACPQRMRIRLLQLRLLPGFHMSVFIYHAKWTSLWHRDACADEVLKFVVTSGRATGVVKGGTEI
eukprot:4862786-Pleurochrysis_carterae.AAC.4